MNEARAHRGISRGGTMCTDNDCWCFDPIQNPWHYSNQPAAQPAPDTIAKPQGSLASKDVSAERRMVAAFVDKWLFESPERKSGGEPWSWAQKADVIRMLMDYGRPASVETTRPQFKVELPDGEERKVHIWFSELRADGYWHISISLEDAPPNTNEALRRIIAAYDVYRGRGVSPAPNEYQSLVSAIEGARSAVKTSSPPAMSATSELAMERRRNEAVQIPTIHPGFDANGSDV